MSKADVRLSKTLTWLLRHGAEKEGLTISTEGWANLEDVLKRPNFKKVGIDKVKEIVANCPKQRFALKEENGEIYIRANQGHSFQVDDLDLEEITTDSDLSTVVHGTYYSHWNSIKEQGLSRMKRTHIHFAPGLPGESGVISGMRSSCQILIYLDLAKALKAGFKFYRSANNVIMCSGNEGGYLPPEYFLKVVDRKTERNLM
ncbi:tRNA 2'-phosphotransferase 1 isoform X1 [Procambarus clarkii]|uniref:tRNA 2'-phosphotransferase 1 isoform X1 n=1 Tax=Procambarus clarkii TaxID=6728 RepID=UPI001E67033F|nr:tRNA 2'-phosphotransferase 1-like isoform X1 [Procambarus clarkii]